MMARHGVLLGLLLAWLALPAHAHEVRPGLLQITETAPQHYDVLWKQPAQGGTTLWLVPHVSNGWLESAPDEVESTATYLLKRWPHRHAANLAGASVSVEGLERTITDVLVSVTLRDGQSVQAILKAGQPPLALEFHRRQGQLSWSYLRLGVEHILTGFDHLLFVFGLMLLVTSRWQLLKTVTAFTVAHSLTLAATALGWISVQFRLIEALVALSIMFLAVELVHLRRGERHYTARHPWVIAFAFGLLHGCAFAGALADIGLPEHAIVPALLLFNMGVEAGQLLFIAAAGAAVWLLRRVSAHWRVPRPVWVPWIAPYAIGSCAAVWFFQRIVIGVGS
jgi:hydrogenase/urease accessory protein HupE